MSPALERELFASQRIGPHDPVAVAQAVAEAKAAELPQPKAGEPEAKVWATSDVGRWVPIGPSAVRRGQASGRPRVVGRIRDLAVSPDGMRAYAGSGMGGVWYTGDAGHSWAPVGGWAPVDPRVGGNVNARSVGCLLVHFDPANNPAQDFVVVGTGEPPPGQAWAGWGFFGGIGVLSGRGPATKAVDADPWEPRSDAGLRQFEQVGFWRIVRHPGRTPGSTTAGSEDELLAATDKGLFKGVRHAVGPAADNRGEYTWTRVTSVDALPEAVAAQPVCDVLWHSDNRIVIALRGKDAGQNPVTDPLHRGGVAWSNDGGTTFHWLTGLNALAATGNTIPSRISLAQVPTTNTIYALASVPAPPAVAPATTPDVPGLFQVADITVAAPAAVAVGGVPPGLWGTQSWYDQTIAAEHVGALDRIYLGGSFHEFPPNSNNFLGGVWCFEVSGAPPALIAVPGISTTAAPAPPAPIQGAGADVAGLVGNNIHPDIHIIRLAGGAAPDRHVWVGCDGGVFVSRSSGRAQSFASRSNGLAAMQPTYLSQHPTSSHFVASGFQDAGMEVREGDTVWEKVALGDGGGTAFHPRRSHHIVSQAFGHGWRKVPSTLFQMPTRSNAVGDVENGIALFYSGAAAIPTGAAGTNGARIAVGTNRVWMTENVGGTTFNTWQVLPFAAAPGAATSDPRNNPAANNAQPQFGVPFIAAQAVTAAGVGPLGGVVTLRWVTPQHLLALYAWGIVRYTEAPAGTWTAVVLLDWFTPGPGVSAAAGRTMLTDILPIAAGGGLDFYLTTTGDLTDPTVDTCYLFTGGAFTATGLRNTLPVPAGAPAGAARPLEPAYSVAHDLVSGNVYAGTVSGCWTRAHGAPPGTNWVRFDNGLPQAAVQDLAIWTDPAPGPEPSPRLLRAAVQARGLWEVNLAAVEPQRTYVRVHLRDDRRRFPTPLANPRRGPGTTEENTFESPDVVVRPRANAGIVPPWVLGAHPITETNVNSYQLWTFQTAFRWLHPSVVADGQWTDTFGDLVELERALRGLPAAPTNPPGQRFIDQALWDSVVQNTRVDPDTGLPSTNAAHPRGVLRPVWHTPSRKLDGTLRQQVPATEVDLMETVQPRSVLNGVWQVHSEVSTVDVLLHHRDMRALGEDEAFAILLSRSGPNKDTLLNSPGQPFIDLGRAIANGQPHVVPTGWTLHDGNVAGRLMHRLPSTLDARMPRAVSVDVDLAGVQPNRFVLFAAIVGNTRAVDGDRCADNPHQLPASPNVRQVSRRWPYLALRLVQVAPRPAP